MNAETLTLAQYLARRDVKALWHRQGIKLNQFSAKDITKAAKSYLSQHPELIEQAQTECLNKDR
jgi:hypothetical protein